MPMTSGLSDRDLPGFWRASDTASKRGQRWVLIYSAARLAGTVVAALGGAMSLTAGRFDVAAAVILGGFAVAFVAEVVSWVHDPEQTWYDGRALAESSKTLAWRYAVGGDPFPATMPESDALELLRTRMDEVSRGTTTKIVLDGPNPVVTPKMMTLRREPYGVRRTAYIVDRTLEQQGWYAKKARLNGRWSTGARVTLVVAEVGALVTAALRVFGGWELDLAGLMGALIAAGAAWVAVKQYGPLATAYSIAARELALQADRLHTVPEAHWAKVAGDAEEAISREHTLWLASRTGKAPL